MKLTGESKCIDCQHKAYNGPVPEGLVPLSLIGCSFPSYQASMCLRFMRLGFEAPTVSKNLYKSESNKETVVIHSPVCKACPTRNQCAANLEPRSYDCNNETVDQDCFSCDRINTCSVLDHDSVNCPEHEDQDEEESEDESVE